MMQIIISGGAQSMPQNGGERDLEAVSRPFPWLPGIGGGASSGEELDSGESMTVSRWEQVSNTIVNSGGILKVSSGGKVDNTTVNTGGNMEVFNRGSAGNTTVNGGGNLTVASGGTATQIKENGGFVEAVNGANVSFVSHTISSFALSAASMTVHSNTSALETAVFSGGIMTVFSGGRADSTTINGGGNLTASSGSILRDTAIASGGVLYLSSGAVHRGTLQLESGAAVSAASGAKIDFDLTSRTSSDGYVINDLSLAGETPIYSVTVSAAQAAGIYKLAQNAAGFTGTITVDCGSTSYGALAVNGSAQSFNNFRYSLTLTSGNLSLNIAEIPPAVFIYSSGTLTSSAGSVSGVVIAADANNQMLISSGGIAENTIMSGGEISIYSGGTANNTTVNSWGCLYVSSGGTAADTILNDGNMSIASGGVASNVAVNSGASLDIASGGTATGVYWTPCVGEVSAADGAVVNFVNVIAGVYNGSDGQLLSAAMTMSNAEVSGSMYVMNSGIANGVTVDSSGIMFIERGGVANDSINNSGSVCVGSGGIANRTINWGNLDVVSGGAVNSTTVNWNGVMSISAGGSAGNTAVSSNGYVYVYSGGSVTLSRVNANGRLYINDGGIASNTTINSSGRFYMSSGGVHRGTMMLESGAIVSAYSGSVVDFTLAGRTSSDGYLINDLALVSGAPAYTVTVAANQVAGTYKLALGAEYFTGTITVGDGSTVYGTVSAGGDDLVYNDIVYTLNKTGGTLTLVIGDGSIPAISNLQGSAGGISWESAESAFNVEYSLNDFAGILRFDTENKQLDTYTIPEGTWQYRVKEEGASGFDAQGSFTANASSGTAAQVISDADGNMDVFFARTAGVWDEKYLARHAGTLNGWNGTRERVALTGKNIICDIYAGSTDANVLVLTDDANGDVLFLDDVFTALGNQARLSNVDEIRAGAGSDIVDLTSPKYAYSGDNMIVYGGAGDDTIWANSGSNILYGDTGNDRIIGGGGDDCLIGGAGNDSLHGGGGNDTFCFGANWGTDTVEQLASGKVILHFETGSLANWDAATGIYSDGSNSVTVTGTSDIELSFGTASTLPPGAFAPAASEKIFESAGSGMLA